MRQLWVLTLVVMSVGACVATDDEGDPTTSVVESRVTEIFRETWDALATGNVDGQNGWSGNCVVFNNVPPNKSLRCKDGAGASKYLGYHGAGSYTLLADLGPNGEVVNSTIGKLSLEGPQGRVFQILFGCDNVRYAFQMNGPTQNMLTFPCGTVTSSSPKPPFRVICNWSTGGAVLSCGAAWRPADPTTYVSLPLPGPLRTFDTVAVSSFVLPGVPLFDKIYIWQN
jgi:hypothetical protein